MGNFDTSGELFSGHERWNVPVGKFVTVSPKIGFAFPITGDGRDNIKFNSWDSEATHVFGGIRLAASFWGRRTVK